MTLDPRKRQKQLERRKAKDKKRYANDMRRRQELSDPSVRAAQGPVLHSAVSESLWSGGIGHVLLSRVNPSGRVTTALFLVDVYCLGVKDVAFDSKPRAVYQANFYQPLIDKIEMTPVSPEHVRKLVEEAVAYARTLGIAPHADYADAQAIFGDLDAGRCTEPFTFGRNGKPFFVSGPHDTPERCASIIERLMESRGQGNFDYMLAMPESKMIAAGLQKYLLS